MTECFFKLHARLKISTSSQTNRQITDINYSLHTHSHQKTSYPHGQPSAPAVIFTFILHTEEHTSTTNISETGTSTILNSVELKWHRIVDPSHSFFLVDEKQPNIRSSMPFFTLLWSGILALGRATSKVCKQLKTLTWPETKMLSCLNRAEQDVWYPWCRQEVFLDPYL